MQLPDSIQQNKRATISHDTTSPCRTSSASAPALIEWRTQQKYESGTEISQEMQKKVIYIINHKRSFALGFWRSPFEVATVCFRIGYRSLQDQKKNRKAKDHQQSSNIICQNLHSTGDRSFARIASFSTYYMILTYNVPKAFDLFAKA